MDSHSQEKGMEEMENNKLLVNEFANCCRDYLNECNFHFADCDLCSWNETTVKFSNPNHIHKLFVGSHIQVPFYCIKEGKNA